MKRFTTFIFLFFSLISTTCAKYTDFNLENEYIPNQQEALNIVFPQNFCSICKCKIKIMLEDERVSSNNEILALIPVYLIGDTSPYLVEGKSPILYNKSASDTGGLFDVDMSLNAVLKDASMVMNDQGGLLVFYLQIDGVMRLITSDKKTTHPQNIHINESIQFLVHEDSEHIIHVCDPESGACGFWRIGMEFKCK